MANSVKKTKKEKFLSLLKKRGKDKDAKYKDISEAQMMNAVLEIHGVNAKVLERMK